MESAPIDNAKRDSSNDIKTKSFCIENNIVKRLLTVNLSRVYIGQQLYDSLSKNPENIGQIDAETGITTSFGQMKELSVRFAIWLRKEGIGSGDIVAFSSPIFSQLYCVVCAIVFVGAAYTPWQYNLDLKSARGNIGLMKPRLILSCEENADLFLEATKLENHVTKIFTTDSEGTKFTSLQEAMATATEEEVLKFEVIDFVDPDSVAYMPLSSGTTGNPKVAVFSYERMEKLIMSYDTEGNSKEGLIRVLKYLYPQWSLTHSLLINYILNGYTMIFHSKYETAQTLRIINKYQVNLLVCDTYELKLLINEDIKVSYDLSCVKTIQTAGSKLFLKMLHLFNKRFPNAFLRKFMGMTEVGPIVCSTETCKNPDSEGVVRPGVQMKVIDCTTNQTLGFYQVGELYVKTPSVMLQYYKNPIKTKEFIDEEGWARTGDLVCIDENGELIIKGRMKDTIRCGLLNILAKDLEEQLVLHSGVEEVVVVPVPHELDYERPFAFVKSFEGAKVSIDELVKLSSPIFALDENYISFTPVDLPRNINGKINTVYLKEAAKKIIHA